jgi:predicted ferric reductase
MTDLAPLTRIGDPPRAAAPPPPVRRLPAPPASPLLGTDLVAGVAALALVVVGTWARHGGVLALRGGGSAAWSSLASLTGLAASAVGLAGLVLVARPRSLERRVGLDRLFVWHRYAGEAMALLVAAHVATAFVAWSSDLGFAVALRELTGGQPYMAAATVGALLVGVVTVTSLRSLRRRLAYETWWFVHLTAYLALALSFSHEIVLGTALAADDVARALWIALHVAVAALLVWRRWGATVAAAARPLRVVQARPVGPGTVELVLAGRPLAHDRGEAGQFVLVRPLRAGLWWQAHPFSLSAAPTTAGFTLTVKDRGDASRAIAALPLGSRVAVEGPYGALGPELLADRKVLFVAGGVGVAPVRALLQRLDTSHEPVVLYRARSTDDLVHLDDLRRLAGARGGRVLTLVGRTATLAMRDPFGATALTAAVPDLRDRVAVVCGPDALLHAARAGLRAAGLPPAAVHVETPWW